MNSIRTECCCLQRGRLPSSVHIQSHNGIRVLSIAWKFSAFNPSPHIGWERRGQFLLITSQWTSTICTVTSIQGNDVCCYLHRWSHEFWDHNKVSCRSPKRKHFRILQTLISLSSIKNQLSNKKWTCLRLKNNYKIIMKKN